MGQSLDVDGLRFDQVVALTAIAGAYRRGIVRVQACEELREIFARQSAANADLSDEEVERIVAEAVAAVRARPVARYTAVFIKDEGGGYAVDVPALPGCATQGDTLEEARRNAHEAIGVYLESLLDDGLPFPKDDPPVVELISVELHELSTRDGSGTDVYRASRRRTSPRRCRLRRWTRASPTRVKSDATIGCAW